MTFFKLDDFKIFPLNNFILFYYCGLKHKYILSLCFSFTYDVAR